MKPSSGIWQSRRAGQALSWALFAVLLAALPAMGQDRSRTAVERSGMGMRSPKGELTSVAEPIEKQISAHQRAVITEEGWPQTFRLMFYATDEAGEHIQREETWYYHDKGRRYSFLNGRLIGQGKADRFDRPGDYPSHRPASFRPGMSFDEVVQIVKPEEVVMEERAEESMRTCWADRIVMGFIEDQLVYVETRPRFAEANGQPRSAEAVSKPRPPAAPPRAAVPPAELKASPMGPVTVFADDFEGEGVTGTWLNWGSGYGGFKQWKVTRGAVDLYAEGGGYCVDLDGTWGMSSDRTSAGRMETGLLRLEPGTYRLEFRVKGNPFQGAKPARAAYPNAFRVTLGAFLDETVSMPHGAPWAPYTYEFSIPAPAEARLVLDHSIVEGDWDGLFIDDIKLVRLP